MTTLIALLFTSFYATADTTLNCSYAYMNVPMTDIELLIYADGEPASSVQVTMGPGTPTHKESVTPEVRAADEFVHLWISKEKPENAIEMIVYTSKKSEGQSVIINHQVPLGSHVWGNCTGLPN